MNHTLESEVEAYCGKCTVVAMHRVVKLNGTRIARVACGTCQDLHAYRKSHPKPAGAFSEAQKAATLRRKATKAASAFDAAMSQVDESMAQPYAHASRFEADDVIAHDAFGLGRVVRILAGNKMEVIFKESSKILMHGVASLGA